LVQILVLALLWETGVSGPAGQTALTVGMAFSYGFVTATLTPIVMAMLLRKKTASLRIVVSWETLSVIFAEYDLGCSFKPNQQITPI